MVSDKIHRGQLQQKNCFFQKMYIDAIRCLYETTNKKNHKYLGYIYKLLPFINLEYNFVCANPLEQDLDKIEMLSITDICEKIGYDKVHFKKLINIFSQVRFDVDGRSELFVSCWKQGQKYIVIINPHIMYSGSDYRKVEVLGAFCK